MSSSEALERQLAVIKKHLSGGYGPLHSEKRDFFLAWEDEILKKIEAEDDEKAIEYVEQLAVIEDHLSGKYRPFNPEEQEFFLAWKNEISTRIKVEKVKKELKNIDEITPLPKPV